MIKALVEEQYLAAVRNVQEPASDVPRTLDELRLQCGAEFGRRKEE